MLKHICMLFASFVIVGSHSVQAQERKDICDGLDLTIDAVVADLKLNTEGIERFCDRIRGLHQGWAEKIRNTEERLEKLEQLVEGQEKINRALSASLPPKGSILLVDDPLACPEGWHDVAQREPKLFAGRSIVASGSADDRETRIYRQSGGAEKHSLLESEMPRHQHPITSSPPSTNIHDGFGGSSNNFGLRPEHDPNVKPQTGWGSTQHAQFMGPKGGNQPHNNMPPYIALYFCKKD